MCGGVTHCVHVLVRCLCHSALRPCPSNQHVQVTARLLPLLLLLLPLSSLLLLLSLPPLVPAGVQHCPAQLE